MTPVVHRLPRRRAWRWVLAATIAVAGSAARAEQPVLAPEPPVADAFRLTPSLELRAFSWKENLPGSDQQALSESGLMLGAGLEGRFSFGPARRAFVDLELRGYFGNVGYEGQTINAQTPVSTTTGYAGFEAHSTAGFVFSPSRAFQVTPRGGFGLELWSRDLDAGGAKGYVENYLTFMLEAAVRLEVLVTPDVGLQLTPQLLMPLVVSERVDLSRQGMYQTVSLSPGLSPRLRLEVGAVLYRAEVALYYEAWTLPESDPDPNGLLQPRSTRQLVGVRVGYGFGPGD